MNITLTQDERLFALIDDLNRAYHAYWRVASVYKPGETPQRQVSEEVQEAYTRYCKARNTLREHFTVECDYEKYSTVKLLDKTPVKMLPRAEQLHRAYLAHVERTTTVEAS